MKKLILRTLLAAGALGAAATAPSFAANIVLNNVDPPLIGFNDPTAATPEGGNSGTTVGEQRLIAYRRALELWGKTLASPATIVVQGSFARLDCARGVLAQAGAVQIFANFPNAPLTNHWYHAALASSLAGGDLAPGAIDPPGTLLNDDIVARFNGDIGKADCLPGPGWYYGLDNNATGGRIDFLDTFMHEVAHGLGFSNFANEATGALILGLPDVYMANTRDLTTGQQWNAPGFGAAQVVASAIRNGNIVWTGPSVTNNASLVLGPYTGLRLTGSLNTEIEFGTASFGAPATASNFGGPIVVGTGAGGSTLGCTAITAPVAGKIAYVDRGTCGFVVKAANAQAAGATGLIVGNNALNGGAFGLGGSDPTLTIPTIGVSTADGAAIKGVAASSAVAGFFVDPSRRAGVAGGYVRLFAPTTVQLGSSISHFDTVAAPNLLMEPAINPDLRSATNLDLTASLMADIGWKLETLKIGFCDTGVSNVMPNGDLLHVKVDQCRAGAKNHGQFMKCMNQSVTQPLVAAGWISGSQKGAITSCAAQN